MGVCLIEQSLAQTSKLKFNYKKKSQRGKRSSWRCCDWMVDG